MIHIRTDSIYYYTSRLKMSFFFFLKIINSYIVLRRTSGVCGYDYVITTVFQCIHNQKPN